ncbi:xanthine dehydrogenase molybdopterin binding subunit [Pelagibius sp. Alg239-R121]|uniref:xanthine dehydrogenase molybdopterin binding subunit n=1 Tax=Pelagibius sp. Alg239-R121 TaxID=2993448 RepID=UPI0024A62540|nr:xanthine dehydrogenase molybdopterin binding subunit [Pelagibius sp. Alg239-R121]
MPDTRTVAPAPITDSESIQGGVHRALKHDSAHKHVTGEAIYVDDIPQPAQLLHLACGQSARAHAKIISMDLSLVRQAPGVVAVLTGEDIPGENDVGPVIHDDPVFADGKVEFIGQSIFAVAAETREQARRAALLAQVEYEDLAPVLSVEDALEQKSFVLPDHVIRRGDSKASLDRAKRRLSGTLQVGGQDHFYLEGMVSLAIPAEDGDVQVWCSTQHPSEVQHNVARVLGRPSNAVTVDVRRMGGGFGGKETQSALFAAIAALTAVRTGRPAKFCVDRDDDMTMTGKRHDFQIDYDVGFDDEGRIEAIEFMQASRCGMSADLSGAISDRAMFHADNAYFLGDVTITSHRCKTNTVSNTAFRGFGGPQGMVGIERVIDEIAFTLGKDPLEVRKLNLYGGEGRNVTPYSMIVEDNVLPEIIEELEVSSDYVRRREDARAFNAKSPVMKKGIALTPVKFGISFSTTHLNQAGALIHIYADGSVHLNHGGTEMGQGLFTKVAQIVAEELQVDLDRIKITASSTGKVPNTSATAASSGTDLNGKAAQAAARTIRERLVGFAASKYDVKPSEVRFRANKVHIGDEAITFDELIGQAYLARVSLSSTGFYKTPKIFYNRETASGRPFYYFAYGAAVSEVMIDSLTGEHKLLRVDILHDAGRSINPAIDLGQIEGGFIQGYGWLTSEELVWDENGRLRTHAPSTYKIPACSDRPEDFRMKLLESGRNREDVIHRSKAIGEPPLMLAISALSALSDAVASVGDYQLPPGLDAPATPEKVLMAVERLRRTQATNGQTEAVQ